VQIPDCRNVFAMRRLDSWPGGDRVRYDEITFAAESAQFFPLWIDEKRRIDLDANAGVFQQGGNRPMFRCGDQRLPSVSLEPTREKEQRKRRAALRHLM
jgi:hypothetical protein